MAKPSRTEDTMTILRGIVRGLELEASSLKALGEQDPLLTKDLSMPLYYIGEAVSALVKIHFKLGEPDGTP